MTLNPSELPHSFHSGKICEKFENSGKTELLLDEAGLLGSSRNAGRNGKTRGRKNRRLSSGPLGPPPAKNSQKSIRKEGNNTSHTMETCPMGSPRDSGKTDAFRDRAEDPSSVDALDASPLGSADPGNSGNTDSFESIFTFERILNPPCIAKLALGFATG